MTLSSKNVNDLEQQKFVESAGTPGQPIVVVGNPDGSTIGGSGGTSMLDDAAFTPGGSSLTPAGFLADDTATDPVDEGDIGVARMNPTTRVQYAQLKDAAGNDVAVGGGTQYAEDTVHASGDQVTLAGVVQQAADAALSGDGDRSLMQVDGTGFLKVNVKAGSAGGTEFAEDAVHSTGALGSQVLAVRKDADTANVDLDGDYASLLVDARGALKVEAFSGEALPVTDNGGSLTVDAVDLDIRNLATGQDKVDARVRNAADSGFIEPATLGEQQTQTTALQLIDDIVHSGAAAISKYAVMGGQFDDAAPTTPAEDQVAAARITSARALHVSVRDALPAGANNIGDVDVLSIAAGDNNIGNVDVATVPAPLSTTGGGTEAAALRVTIANDSTGLVSIDDNGGSLTVDQATAANLNAQVVGPAAHDAAASGNPLLAAGIAQDSDDTAPPNRVSAEGDATRLATDRDGSLHVLPFGPQIWSYHENSSSALTDVSVHAAPAAGLSLYVTDVVVSTGAATAFNVFFEEGATTVLGPYYLEAVAGRGLAIHFNTPKKITAATALTVTTSAAIAHGIDVTGFVAQG